VSHGGADHIHEANNDAVDAQGYRIMQGIQRGLWKWSVETETGTKSGTSESKDAAMNAARRVIDNALNPK